MTNQICLCGLPFREDFHFYSSSVVRTWYFVHVLHFIFAFVLSLLELSMTSLSLGPQHTLKSLSVCWSLYELFALRWRRRLKRTKTNNRQHVCFLLNVSHWDFLVQLTSLQRTQFSSRQRFIREIQRSVANDEIINKRRWNDLKMQWTLDSVKSFYYHLAIVHTSLHIAMSRVFTTYIQATALIKRSFHASTRAVVIHINLG